MKLDGYGGGEGIGGVERKQEFDQNTGYVKFKNMEMIPCELVLWTSLINVTKWESISETSLPQSLCTFSVIISFFLPT